MQRNEGPWLLVLFGAAAACGSSTNPPSSTPSAGAAGTTSLAGSAGSSNHQGGSSNGGGGASSSGTAGSGTSGSAGSGNEAGSGGDSVTTGGLEVSPTELVFGAVQQTVSMPAMVTLKNTGSTPVQIDSLALDAQAAGTAAFELVMTPAAGLVLTAGASKELEVRFHPSGIALFESQLLLETSPAVDPIALFGLGTKGLEGENEPYLKIVLTTLGYDVDVGGNALLSTTTPLVGTEVAAPRFRAAGAGEITITPVARYSPQEPIPYGYYAVSGEVEVGVIADDQFQALNPSTDAGSKPSFMDPGGEFGIFTTSKTHKSYTEDIKNAANATKHAVRTYPLKDRAGQAVQHAYLVCFEEAANGDYQDYVFTLTNVIPVAP